MQGEFVTMPMSGTWIHSKDVDPIDIPVIEGIYHIPNDGHKGAFGTVRKNHIHEGVDIYCPEYTPVVAIYSGVVTGVGAFTGEQVGSPWWEDTSYTTVFNNQFGTVNYGEITSFVKRGDFVKAGEVIGVVKRVLKKNKGYPTSMLHLEWYKGYVEKPIDEWSLTYDGVPDKLQDISLILKCILEGYKINRRNKCSKSDM